MDARRSEQRYPFQITSDLVAQHRLPLTDSAQAATYTYGSWEENTGTTGTKASTNPWTYAGGYNDTTSNRIKFGARYYHRARGRFTQPDLSAQEANRYLYAQCNPVNFTDPTGLVSTGCWIAVGATLLAGAAFIAAGGILLSAYAYGVAIFFAEVQFASAGFGLFAAAFGGSQICFR